MFGLMVTTRKRLTEALSRPGVRLRSWRRLPPLSRIAVCFLAVVVLTALFAPLARPATTRSTSRPWSAAPARPPPTTGWARTAWAGTS